MPGNPDTVMVFAIALAQQQNFIPLRLRSRRRPEQSSRSAL
jgi:hypothetical protein